MPRKVWWWRVKRRSGEKEPFFVEEIPERVAKWPEIRDFDDPIEGKIIVYITGGDTIGDAVRVGSQKT